MRAFLAALMLCLATPALGRDNGQWDGTDPAIGAWFARQRQPDDRRISCCGEADAYYADRIEIRDGKFFAVITDDREDAPLQRPHRDIGSVVEIPAHKFNDPRSDPNLTGHGIVFVGSSGQAFCYFNMPGEN